MTLATLISIADKKFPMVLYTNVPDPDGEKKTKGVRYNFATNIWDTNTSVTVDKIITIGEFRQSELYKRIRTCDLVTFATQPTRSISTLSDEYKTTHPMVVSISIKSPYPSYHPKGK